MAWSDHFKELLRDRGRLSHGGVRESIPYRPRFRLVIGTPAIAGHHLGAWEKDVAKVLEISSHPYCSSVSSAYATHKDSTWPTTGHEYRYVVGLTGQIRTGAQSVTPRTWIYQGATLSVGVTKEAATAAMNMPIGTLSRLEMSLEDEATTFTVERSEDTPWETIHIGQYRGMKWTGDAYTLDFADALEAANQRATDDGTYGNDDYTNRWFAGVGEKLTVKTTFTSYTGGNLETTASFATNHKSRAGKMYKHRDSWPGGSSYHHGLSTSHVDQNNWAVIQNTSSKTTYVLYESIFNTGELSLSDAQSASTGSTSAVEALPGYLHPMDVTGGIGAGSTVTMTCLLHGTPVDNIVNTIYTQGYHKEMVPGIFGERVGTMASEPLNIDDLEKHQDLFDAVLAADGDAGLGGFATTRPFAAIITSSPDNGASLVKSLCGKWGCFPRFKEGGYSVGLIVDEQRRKDKVTENEVIFWDDIQGASYEQANSAIQGVYQHIDFVSTDEDDDGAHPSSTFTGVGGLPQIGNLTVGVTEVAANMLTKGKQYADYFLTTQSDWWHKPHDTATFRLRGFRFAHLAPGDAVHVVGPEMKTSGMGSVPSWGPIGWGSASVLATIGFDPSTDSGIDLGDPHGVPWLVTSVSVDWVGCLVTIAVTRMNRIPSSAKFRDTATDDVMSTRMGITIGRMPTE